MRQKKPANALVSLEEYVATEIEEVAYIYQVLFPQRQVIANLSWGEDDPIYARPSIEHSETLVSPDRMGPGFLGRVVLQPEGTAFLRGLLYVNLSIPRRPTPAEFEQSREARLMRSRKGRAVFRASPLLFEQIKHLAEVRREKLRRKRHHFSKLPLAHNISLSIPDERGNSDADPAILIGFHWLEVGGAENLAFDTVEWALEAGLRVFVVADRPEHQRLADQLPDDPRVKFIRIERYLERHRHVKFIERLIARENIRILHSHHCGILYESLPTLRLSYPDLMILDSTHITEYHDGGYPRLSGVWSNFIDMHHVISKDLLQFYRDSFRISGKVKLGRLLHESARETAPSPIRMKAGQEAYRVAFVGRMTHQKRPILLIETIRRLVKWSQGANIKLSFDVVGEGPYREAVEYLLSRYGLRGYVTLHAANTDVPALLSRSDIMLLPSANEGLALVCYEAIEQGCIPITTDVGAQREITPESLMVPRAPYKTAAGMVGAVQRLVADQDFIDEMARELNDKYRQLSSEPIAKELLMPYYRAAAAEGDETAVKD